MCNTEKKSLSIIEIDKKKTKVHNKNWDTNELGNSKTNKINNIMIIITYVLAISLLQFQAIPTPKNKVYGNIYWTHPKEQKLLKHTASCMRQ